MVSKEAELLFNKFVKQVDYIFKKLHKPLEWQSFYIHELPLLMDICEEVRKVSIQKGLNRSQIRALESLKEVSSEEFQMVTAYEQESTNPVMESDSVDSSQIGLRELSENWDRRIMSHYPVLSESSLRE